MKKIPRDITGYELIKIIGKFGYQITRQTGSHIRLTTTENGIPRWREIVSRASFGTKDKITVRLYNQSFRTPVSCLCSE